MLTQFDPFPVDACNFSCTCTKDGACVQRHSNDVCVCNQNLDIVFKCKIRK